MLMLVKQTYPIYILQPPHKLECNTLLIGCNTINHSIQHDVTTIKIITFLDSYIKLAYYAHLRCPQTHERMPKA